jgi:hypothetical protein
LTGGGAATGGVTGGVDVSASAARLLLCFLSCIASQLEADRLRLFTVLFFFERS